MSRLGQMVKALPLFLAGAMAGAVGAWGVYGKRGESAPAPTPAPIALRCDEAALTQARVRLAELERELTLVREQTVKSPPPASAEVVDSSSEGVERVAKEEEESLNWKISAIEKFVPLSGDQKARLKEKYQAERDARQRGVEAETEKLDDIIGAENAGYYRQQVQAAFKRMEAEETEKEVLLIARQLSLSSQQEESVRRVFADVESRLESVPTSNESTSAHDRVKMMIEENRRRGELRAEELKKVLTPAQYQSYLASQAESAAADVEVFHDPSAH